MAQGYIQNGKINGGSPLDLSRLLQGSNCDAGQVAALNRELIAVRREIVERPHPPLNSVMVIPRDFSAGAWAQQTSFVTGDGFAEMKPVTSMGGDAEEVAVSSNETLNPVREFEVAYGFSRKELIIAAKLGTPLSARKARQANRAYEELVDKLAAKGDADLGIKGILSYKGIPRETLSKSFKSMTVDEILKFLHGLFEKVNENTQESREANTMVLPRNLRDYLAHTRIGGGDGNMSILSVFLQENSYCEGVQTWKRFSGAGATRKSVKHDVIGAWRPDPDLIRQQIPEAYAELEPEMSGGRTVTNCVASIGSVEVIDEKAIMLAEVPQAA